MDKKQSVELEKFEWERRDQPGKLYNVFGTGDPSWDRMRVLLPEINNAAGPEKARPYLKQVLGSYPDSSSITPPVYFDIGNRTFFGEGTFVNMDCMFMDPGIIRIGNGVQIGPRCSFYSPVHPMDPEIRSTMLETTGNIVVEDNVWFGGSCVINPGVTIGEGSVIGSGSVVTKDIPAGVFAAGNPCRVIRILAGKDKAYWKEKQQEYLQALNQFKSRME